MKKIIVLAATALLLAGCSATASSAPSATPAAMPVSGVSAGASSAPAAGGSTAAATASAPAAASASASAYPALSLAETCTRFIKLLADNAPAQGSSDNQKYWATVRDGLIPIRAGAAAETKTDLEGVFTWYNTRAEHWDLATAQQLGKAAAPSLSRLTITCKAYMPKR